MPKPVADPLQLLRDELAYRKEHYDPTEREAGVQYGIRRSIHILERQR